jgi:type II secretory pathway pseudopilin PulG
VSIERGASQDRLRPRAEDGDTLIEVLVAVMMLGVAVVVLLGGLGTGIRITDVHRKQAAASAYLHTFAETLESAVAASPTAYRDCADWSVYDPLFRITDTTYESRVASVSYWDGSAFTVACPGADTGVQRLLLRVRSSDDAAVEELNLIIRKPCRSVDATCR